MNKEKNSNRSLILSIISIMICILLLIGATVAWFTDTETNTGNTIEAGTLDITAQWYNVGTGDSTYAITGTDYSFTFADAANDFATTSDSMIDESNWQPGDVNAKLVEVTNNGTLEANISLAAMVEDGGMEDALWFDFIAVNGSVTTGTFTVRAMYTLSQIVSGQTFTLGAEESVQFILVYGMLESAGDTYQESSYTADIIVTATQTNVTDTVVYADDVDEIKNAKTNQTVILMDDITSEDFIELDTNVNFDLNGYTLTVSSFTMETDDYCTVDIANGTIKSTEDSFDIQIPNGTINIDATTVAIESSSQVIIDASYNTLNLTGTTQFVKLDSSGEITTTKATVTIMADTRVVVDTDNVVSLQAEEGASNVEVEDATTGASEVLTEEATEYSATTVVTTEMEFLVAVIKGEKMSLSGDLSIDTSEIYSYGSNSYVLVAFMQSFGVDIDLNGYKLTITSPLYSIGVYDGKPFAFKNGDLEVVYSDGANYATGAFVTYENAVLTLTNVNYSTNASGVLVSGPNATVNVTNSSITAPWYCLATNASATNGVVVSQGLIMNYTGSTFTTTVAGGIPVFLNVPGTLTMDDCIVNSEDTGVLIRGGTAIISNTVINSNYDYDYELDEEGNYFFLDGSWSSGTGVPFAGIVLGNRGGSSYAYDTDCTLNNVTVNLTGSESDYAVYVWGHEATDSINDGEVELNFDYTDCTFDGYIYVGGDNVTINNTSIADSDVAGTYDGTTVTYPVTAAAATYSLFANSISIASEDPIETAVAVTVDEEVTYIPGEEVYLK